MNRAIAEAISVICWGRCEQITCLNSSPIETEVELPAASFQKRNQCVRSQYELHQHQPTDFLTEFRKLVFWLKLWIMYLFWWNNLILSFLLFHSLWSSMQLDNFQRVKNQIRKSVLDSFSNSVLINGTKWLNYSTERIHKSTET